MPFALLSDSEIILFRRVEVDVVGIVIRSRPLYAGSESCPSVPDLLADTEVQPIVYVSRRASEWRCGQQFRISFAHLTSKLTILADSFLLPKDHGLGAWLEPSSPTLLRVSPSANHDGRPSPRDVDPYSKGLLRSEPTELVHAPATLTMVMHPSGLNCRVRSSGSSLRFSPGL